MVSVSGCFRGGPASRVAIDTFSLLLAFGPPAPKLIVSDEFNVIQHKSLEIQICSVTKEKNCKMSCSHGVFHQMKLKPQKETNFQFLNVTVTRKLAIGRAIATVLQRSWVQTQIVFSHYFQMYLSCVHS